MRWRLFAIGSLLFAIGSVPGYASVIAHYAAVETLFGPTLTRYDVARRYDAGARITLAPAGGTIPSGTDVLFLLTPDDALIPATTSRPLVPRSGDTLVVLR